MMNTLTRRSLLRGLGGFAATTTLASCGSPPLPGLTEEARAIDQLVKPETLEKPDLTVGFVPVNDCAPFAVAYTKGFFWKYGLNVHLSREASWGTSRDGVIFGRLDAAPVVSGAVTNARIGAEGARHAPMCAAMTIHRHGNAMTMNRAMWEAGLRPLRDYNGDLEAFGQDFRRYFAALPSDRRIWAVVLSSAIYEYFVRYVAAAVGVPPDEEFRIIIIPPPQMVSNVRIGAMQAYMVAEPWNTRAITGNEGVGFTFVQGKEIWQGHPDRVLAVMEPFIQNYPKTYRSLVKALIEACQFCSNPANHAEVVEIISSRSFTRAKPQYTKPAITGAYSYGGFDGQNRVVQAEDTTLFFDLPSSVAHPENDHSTFLWQSQSLWLMTQAARWGQIDDFPADAEAKARQAWRTDLYREIAAEMGIACPAEDYKVEPPEVFIDRKAFDPSDPVRYLNSFEIRAKAPTRIYLTA